MLHNKSIKKQNTFVTFLFNILNFPLIIFRLKLRFHVSLLNETTTMPRSTQESTVSRRKKILQLLSDSGQVLVDDLSKEFSVSEVTIRNDLDQLEKKNQLIRARGGAIKLETGVGLDQRLADK